MSDRVLEHLSAGCQLSCGECGLDDRIASTDRYHLTFHNHPWHHHLGIDPKMSSKSSSHVTIVGEASHSENGLQDLPIIRQIILSKTNHYTAFCQFCHLQLNLISDVESLDNPIMLYSVSPRDIQEEIGMEASDIDRCHGGLLLEPS